MPAIGITGGISTGKTTFCRGLGELIPDAKFFDADKAARDLVDLDPQVKEELRRGFGPETYLPGGALDRGEIARHHLSGRRQKERARKILHPRIRQQWSAEAEKHRHSSDFFFADIPLLYETSGETWCDRVVVIACSRDIQLARLLERGRIDHAAAEQIIDSQMPLMEKIKRADHVVWNNGDRSVLAEQTAALVRLWRGVGNKLQAGD